MIYHVSVQKWSFRCSNPPPGLCSCCLWISLPSQPTPLQSTPDFGLCSHFSPSFPSPRPTVLFVSNVSTFFALLPSQSCYTSSPFHSSFPFTSSVANLSVCMSVLSLFCQGIPASSSINCCCIPSTAARLSIHPHRLIPAVSFRSIHFSRMLDKARE